MNEDLFKIDLASLVITNTYNKLIKYSYNFMEDSMEYNDVLDKIKNYIQVENELYNKLTINDINTYFQIINGCKRFNTIKDSRIYNRMNDYKRELEGAIKLNGILLSSAISSKLLIDVLKYVNKSINNLSINDNIDKEDIIMLDIYNKRMKYHYLTANSYLETIAIDNKFDITKIPAYSFNDIENTYHVKFIYTIKDVLLTYAINAINELANLKTGDKYLLSYSSLFEIGRIEAILPYLDIKGINNILELYQSNSYKYDSNSALRKVKKIIYKKKEEFN